MLKCILLFYEGYTNKNVFSLMQSILRCIRTLNFVNFPGQIMCMKYMWICAVICFFLFVGGYPGWRMCMKYSWVYAAMLFFLLLSQYSKICVFWHQIDASGGHFNMPTVYPYHILIICHCNAIWWVSCVALIMQRFELIQSSYNWSAVC